MHDVLCSHDGCLGSGLREQSVIDPWQVAHSGLTHFGSSLATRLWFRGRSGKLTSVSAPTPLAFYNIPGNQVDCVDFVVWIMLCEVD